MTRIDRYILSQLLVLFSFFALVLVAIFWINRAVTLFDRLIGDGQSALVFLEFTVLGLPRLITTVMPIAAFAATVYLTNKLSNESELTVMQATGCSPWRLTRPVLLFAVLALAGASLLSHVLRPLSQAQLSQREAEISQNVTARLLTEGVFLNPTRNVTFYTRTIGTDGVLRDVFLSDRRDPKSGVIYTASKAYLVRNGPGTTLIMVDGLAQRMTSPEKRLSTARFLDFSFDITALVRNDAMSKTTPSKMVTTDLIAGWDSVIAQPGQDRGAVLEELNARITQPLFCVVAAMIGFSTLLTGGYSRFGLWRKIVLAFGLLIAIDGFAGRLQEPVRNDPQLWPILYIPVLTGTVIVLFLLWHAANPNAFRRIPRGAPGLEGAS